MKKYVICKIIDILGNPLVNQANQNHYGSKEEAIMQIPNEQSSPKEQYLVIYKESDENGIIVKSKIVHFT